MLHEIIPITTQLRLVQLNPAQATRLFALTESNRAYIGEFLSWPTHVHSVDDARAHIEKTLANRASGTSYTYGIEFEDEIVGNISLRHLADNEKAPEIGYWIAQSHAGKGLTSAAVKALTAFGLQTLQLESIVIKADIRNIGSNKVAEKAGYTKTGTISRKKRTLNVWTIRSTPSPAPQS